MMITWSRHGREPIDSPQELVGVTGYPEAPTWEKSPGRSTLLIHRSPVPEILMGSSAATRHAIAAIPARQTRKYVSCVMSFSRSDIEVAAFNAGHPGLRSSVDHALQLFLALLFAGLEPRYCPAHFVTTHTHTGRLEVNILIACSVFNPVKGKFYCLNPNPDRKGYRDAHRACQDVLNTRYGWADPQDPQRRQWLKRPDWWQKKNREEKRAGLAGCITREDHFFQVLDHALAEAEARDRSDLLDAIATTTPVTGYTVVRSDRRSITVGYVVNGEVTDKLRLTGEATQILGRRLGDACNPTVLAARQAAVEKAPSVLREAYEKQAAYNAKRYGQARMADTVSVLLDPATTRTRLIPARHIDLVSDDIPHPIGDLTHELEPHTSGTAPAPGRRPDQSDVDRPIRGTENAKHRTMDRGEGLAAATRGLADLRYRFDRYARSAVAVLTARRALAQLIPRMDRLMRLIPLWHARTVPFTPDILTGLAHAGHHMETQNDRFDAILRAGRNPTRPVPGPVAPRQLADNAGTGGRFRAIGDAAGGHTSSDHRGSDPAHGRHPDGANRPSGAAQSHGRADGAAGGAEYSAGVTDGPTPRPDEPALQLARRTAPTDSRAALIRRTREALPQSCHVKWQQMPEGEGLVIMEDPETTVLWIPGTGIWTDETPHHQKIVTALTHTFDPALTGVVIHARSDVDPVPLDADDSARQAETTLGQDGP